MKKKLDLNQLAKSIVELATGETAPKNKPVKKKTDHVSVRESESTKTKNSHRKS